MAEVENKQGEFQALVESMTSSVTATRESIKKISSQLDTNTKDGISLLSLKHHLMLSYLQSLVLTSTHRILGHSLNDRSSSRQPFSKVERVSRGSRPGDLVDSMIENRVVLEKVTALENKMRYQIEKLVRLAEETPEEAQKSVVNDPLAFRPNPQNLMNQASESSGSEVDSDEETRQTKANDGIYRPPKMAPMPYNEENSRSKKERRRPITSALSQISMSAYNPHVETTSGLGGTPSLASARARELARMTEFEEENFTRLVLKKKDAKRRQRDEEDIALGGTGAGLTAGPRGRAQRGVGLEDEFADVFKSVGRRKDGAIGDGYEELRQRGKKNDALSRARMRRQEDIDVSEGPRRKKGRFEKDQATMKKILQKKRR